MHRGGHPSEIWEPCLAYALGYVCNDPEYETTCDGFILAISLQGSKNPALFEWVLATVNITNNLGIISLVESSSLSYIPLSRDHRI